MQTRLNVQKPKSETIAFGLNFLLAGAGFGYLGRWKLALLNLALALGIGVVAAVALPEAFLIEHGRIVTFGIAGGSGGWAMATARQMNEQREAEMEQRVDEIGDDG